MKAGKVLTVTKMEPEPVEVLRAPAGTLWWRDDCFWHYSNEPGYEVSAAEVEKIVDAALRYTGGRRAPLLIDRSNSYSPSLDAMRTFPRLAPRMASAVAYYAPRLEAVAASQVVRTAFLKPLEHVEIFENMDDAIAWLKRFVGEPPTAA